MHTIHLATRHNGRAGQAVHNSPHKNTTSFRLALGHIGRRCQAVQRRRLVVRLRYALRYALEVRQRLHRAQLQRRGAQDARACLCRLAALPAAAKRPPHVVHQELLAAYRNQLGVIVGLLTATTCSLHAARLHTGTMTNLRVTSGLRGVATRSSGAPCCCCCRCSAARCAWMRLNGCPSSLSSLRALLARSSAQHGMTTFGSPAQERSNARGRQVSRARTLGRG